jgi:hypothetical protein
MFPSRPGETYLPAINYRVTRIDRFGFLPHRIDPASVREKNPRVVGRGETPRDWRISLCYATLIRRTRIRCLHSFRYVYRVIVPPSERSRNVPERCTPRGNSGCTYAAISVEIHIPGQRERENTNARSIYKYSPPECVPTDK